MMKQNAALLMTLCTLWCGCAQSFGPESSVDQTYAFVVTNKYGQDILLIGPENEDTRIGVLGRKFHPASSSAAKRAAWPVGVWTAVGSPPDTPAWVQWKYTLTLANNGQVTFREEEYGIVYSPDLKTVLKDWTLSRTLHLSGNWRIIRGQLGEIHFTKRNEIVPNKPVEGTR